MDRIERIRQSFVSPRLQESDTHEYISRREADHHKRKRDNGDHWQDHEQDLTDISVEALITYLHGLIGQGTDNTTEDAKQIDPDMRQAIAAYTHEDPKPQPRPMPAQQAISDEESHDRIREIISGLEGLLTRNIDHITLLPAKTFLDCVEKTVEKYKAI